MSSAHEGLLELARRAAAEASTEILEIYRSGDFQTDMKGDNSPLTLADRKAHTLICDCLMESEIPVLSEEGKSIPFETRRNWPRFWLIDPLDGTREFLKRNGEFTVNIALIEAQSSVLGVVAVPATGEMYFASKGNGAYLVSGGQPVRLPRRIKVDTHKRGIRVVASRSHLDDETRQFLERLNHPEVVTSGSSLKFMRVATGQADLYPRFAPTMEWDTAAAHIIVNEVGLGVYQKGTKTELLYNKESLLNPHFLCG